jgi:hypothetical protein
MFENAFTHQLTILYPDGQRLSVNAIVRQEEIQRQNGVAMNTATKLEFIIQSNIQLDVYNQICYRDQLFDIKSISLLESIDGKLVYYKIKVA